MDLNFDSTVVTIIISVAVLFVSFLTILGVLIGIIAKFFKKSIIYEMNSRTEEVHKKTNDFLEWFTDFKEKTDTRFNQFEKTISGIEKGVYKSLEDFKKEIDKDLTAIKDFIEDVRAQSKEGDEKLEKRIDTYDGRREKDKDIIWKKMTAVEKKIDDHISNERYHYDRRKNDTD